MEFKFNGGSTFTLYEKTVGVDRSTTNALVTRELVRYSLQEKCIIKNMKYIRCDKSNDECTLVKPSSL